MKTIILMIVAALALRPQVQQQVMLAGGTDIPNAPVDSNSGGGCTGSSGAWTCTGAPTITLTDASASLIYYSTSGTPACPSTGTLYTGPFTGPGSTFTLKAIGCNGITGGAVLTSVYTISAANTVTPLQNVTNASCTFSVYNRVCAFGSNTGSGNTISGCMGWITPSGGSTGLTISISDTQGLSWSVDASSRQVADATTNYAEIGVQCFHSTTTTTAAAETVTISINDAPAATSPQVYELHGSGGSVVYQVGSVGNGNSRSVTTASITPSANGSFEMAMVILDDSAGIGTAFTAGSGWTLTFQNGGGEYDEAVEFQAQSSGSANAVTGAFTIYSGVTPNKWVDSQQVFHP